jgi:hypothetical protein
MRALASGNGPSMRADDRSRAFREASPARLQRRSRSRTSGLSSTPPDQGGDIQSEAVVTHPGGMGWRATSTHSDRSRRSSPMGCARSAGASQPLCSATLLPCSPKALSRWRVPGIRTGSGTAFACAAIEPVSDRLEMTNPRRPRFVYVLSDGGWAHTAVERIRQFAEVGVPTIHLSIGMAPTRSCSPGVRTSARVVRAWCPRRSRKQRPCAAPSRAMSIPSCDPLGDQ